MVRFNLVIKFYLFHTTNLLFEMRKQKKNHMALKDKLKRLLLACEKRISKIYMLTRKDDSKSGHKYR